MSENPVTSAQRLQLTIITVGPVIPNPRARLIGNVCGVFLLQLAIEVERRKVLRPVDAIFVHSSDIPRRRASRLCRRGAGLDGLIGVPEWNRCALRRLRVDVIGLGVRIGEIFYITLLRIV